MPIISPSINITMIGAGVPFLTGISYPALTMAISNSVQIYTVGSVSVIYADVGLVGPQGTGIGSIVNSVSTSLKASLDSFFLSNGLLGEHAPNLTNAISIAVSAGLAAALTMSTVLGVAVGSGIGRLQHPGPNPLTGLLISQFISSGILGSHSPILAKAISEGYISFLDTLIAVQSIAGSPTPPPVPGATSSIGKII